MHKLAYNINSICNIRLSELSKSIFLFWNSSIFISLLWGFYTSSLPIVPLSTKYFWTSCPNIPFHCPSKSFNVLMKLWFDNLMKWLETSKDFTSIMQEINPSKNSNQWMLQTTYVQLQLEFSRDPKHQNVYNHEKRITSIISNRIDSSFMPNVLTDLIKNSFLLHF